MQVQFKWSKSGIWGDKDERRVDLTYPIGSRGNAGTSIDKGLQKRIEAIDGVTFVYTHSRYHIDVHFGKLFNPDERKEQIIETIREWIENQTTDDEDDNIEVVMVEIENVKGNRNLKTTKHYDKVKAFMQNGGQETPDCVTIPDDKTLILRARLMLEEVMETIQDGLGLEIVLTGIDPDEVRKTFGAVEIEKGAIQSGKIMFLPKHPVNLVELADGCADVKVVTTGTLIAFGIPDDRLQDIVDDSNLAKGSNKDAHGKIQKPAGWQPPNVRGFLEGLGVEFEVHKTMSGESAILKSLPNPKLTSEMLKEAGNTPEAKAAIDPTGGGRGA